MDRKLGLGLLATVGLLFGNLAAGLALWPTLFPRPAYLATDLLLLLLAGFLLLLGFRLSQEGSRVVPRALVAAAAVLVTWVPLEIYVTFGLCQTSGAGSDLCQTHRNWMDRVPVLNRWGSWEDELGPESDPASRTRGLMVVLGDSWTWGQGLRSREERFSDLVGRGLPEVQVVNFGRCGASTGTQVHVVWPRVREVHPDLVLLAWRADDIQSSLALAGEPGPRHQRREPVSDLDRPRKGKGGPPPDGFKRNHPLAAGLPLVNYLFWRARAMGDRFYWGRFFEDPVLLADHAAQLNLLLDRIREEGARPVVALLPNHFLFEEGDRERRDGVYASVTSVLQATGTPVIPLQDLEDRFPLGHYEVNPMDPHPGPALHAAIADGIVSWFREHPELLQRSARQD